MKSAVVRVEKDQESDQVTVALLGLRSNIVTDQQRALDVIERLADSDPIACDLLRRSGCTGLLVKLARSTDSSIADRAAAVIATLCGEASRGPQTKTMSIGGLDITLHELAYIDVGVGFKTWPSAVALVQAMIAGRVQVKDQDILELGCGTGLVGIVAGLLGARSVLLTDYLPSIINNAAANLRANRLNASSFKTSLLDWKTSPSYRDSLATIKPSSSNGSSSPPLLQQYELILASDVVYEQGAVTPLLNTLAATLSCTGVAHIVLPLPSLRYCIADFEKEASEIFNVSKRNVPGEDLTHYVLSHATSTTTFK